MCVSVARAEFSGTTVYAGRRWDAGRGVVHVLGYQNTALNLARGPNAMLLHLPARGRVGPGNFVPVGRGGGFLDRMVDAVRPVYLSLDDGIDWMGGERREPVQVFEHDVYTVLLAEDARAIPAALARVEPRKRPRLGGPLMEFYADHYPRHRIAVCCFDNAEAARAKPLLVWYEPAEPDVLTAPALDCHTGEPPELGAEVPVDHWVVFGTDEAPVGWGAPVAYGGGLRQRARELLPDSVMGLHFGEDALVNGDFSIAHDALLAGDLDRIRRTSPTP